MERCLSGHLYAMMRGDEECPICVANKVKNDRIAELERLLAIAISIIKDLRPDDPSPVYGVFPGGDPREFSPDSECSTEAELAQHKADCEAWDRGEQPRPKLSGSEYDESGKLIVHVCRSAYGLGSYLWDDEWAKEKRTKVDSFLSESEGI